MKTVVSGRGPVKLVLPQASAILAQMNAGSRTHLIPKDALWRIVSTVGIEKQLCLVRSPRRQRRSFSVSLGVMQIPVSCHGKLQPSCT